MHLKSQVVNCQSIPTVHTMTAHVKSIPTVHTMTAHEKIILTVHTTAHVKSTHCTHNDCTCEDYENSSHMTVVLLLDSDAM